ncbi:MAG: endo-1,4-beta-xylanase [Acidobacteriota bacterium]
MAAACLLTGCHDRSPTMLTPSTPTTPSTSDRPLTVAASALGKYVGTAVQSGLLSDPLYRTVVDREFGSLTAEYEMKWATQEPSPGAFNFGPGDQILAYADSHGMRLRAHTLLWHGSVPSWLESLSPDGLRLAVTDHIRAAVGHYRGRVRAWDVVNEAVADDGSGLRDTVFRRGLGDGYIAEAFRLAREADPGAMLFYNDYNGEGTSAKSDRIYQLVRDLKAAGVPIDGVGLQMHVSASGRPSDASIATNMRRLADLGVVVAITEMDVKINGVAGSPQTRLDAQRAAYRAVVGLCVAERGCEGVTFWGFTDAHTWITGDSPLLYDAQYQPKPAYFGVLDALSGR